MLCTWGCGRKVTCRNLADKYLTYKKRALSIISRIPTRKWSQALLGNPQKYCLVVHPVVHWWTGAAGKMFRDNEEFPKFVKAMAPHRYPGLSQLPMHHCSFWWETAYNSSVKQNVPNHILKQEAREPSAMSWGLDPGRSWPRPWTFTGSSWRCSCYKASRVHLVLWNVQETI